VTNAVQRVVLPSYVFTHDDVVTKASPR